VETALSALKPSVNLDVLVLAGGLGTRLANILGDVPKILAPVGGRPFLYHLLNWLAGQGASRVILCLGFRADAVLNCLPDLDVLGLSVVPVCEPSPLGTAGAVAFALRQVKSDSVLVMNGDTFIEADLPMFVNSHRQSGATVSLVAVEVEEPGRYGRLEIDSSCRVRCFEEKSCAAIRPSWINGGLYIFERAVLESIAQLGRGSLERDVLQRMAPLSIHAFRTNGAFIDIGTPETLERASSVLSRRTGVK